MCEGSSAVTTESDKGTNVFMPKQTEPIEFDESLKGPLEGVRVLDLSRLVAGNMLSLQLGDFGADVVKIEPPKGDALRHWQENGHSLHWKTYGRNKRSVCMDLRNPSEMEALLHLAESADVFIENFRPGTLEKMGLAPEVLMKQNPKLIVMQQDHTSIVLFNESGKLHGRAILYSISSTNQFYQQR